MNRKIVKLSSLTLTLMIVLGSVAFYRAAVAVARQRIYVDPAVNTFFTDTTAVGATFPVAIKTADFVAPGVFSYQLKLFYDTSMLSNATNSGSIPADQWLTPTLDPGNIFKVKSGEIDPVAGSVLFSVTLLGDEPGKIGGGTLGTVTLKIIKAPPVNQNLTSLLELKEVVLSDPSPAKIDPASYDLVPATFTYASPPLVQPWVGASSQTWDNTGADAAGRLFKINVSIHDLAADWHAVGFQFRLSFDGTLIETKAEWVFPGDFATQFGATWNTTFVNSNVVYGQLILPPWQEPWAHGSGTLATIQFNATYSPPPAASTDLVLSDVEIVDADTNLIPYSRLENGKYTITVAPPPWLSVDPTTFTFATLGSELDLKANINAIAKGFRLVGVELKVRYNTTLLTIENITEGGFMKGFAQGAGTDTFFQAYIEEDHGLIGIIILPLPDGTWPDSVFPEGTGTLATLKFKSIFQLTDQDILTSLTLFDPLLVDADAKVIPIDEQKTAAQGTCACTLTKSAPPPPAGPPPHPEYPYSIDLFTQYVSLYGGQGYNRPSDAFPPQAEIVMMAEATYFGDAVVGKPVVISINGPGGVQYSAVVSTDGTGIAELRYVVPWAEESFGLWTAQASWQIGSKVITDTMKFRVGFLVSVTDVSLATPETTYLDPRYNTTYPVYYKGKTYTLSMNLAAITMQSPGACMAKLMGISPSAVTAISIFDELGQPVAYQAPSAPQLYGAALPYDEQFVLQQKTQLYTVGPLSITIGPNAFSGRASVQSSVLTATFGGFTYCEPTIDYIWIWSQKRTTGPTLKGVPTSLEAGEGTVKPNSVVSIPITIHDVDPSSHIVGLQFRLQFDTSIVGVADVIEGDFVKQFGSSTPPTYFTWRLDGDVLVGVLQLPPWPGTNGWMSGSGTVCTIKFTALYQAPPPTGSTLVLYNAFMVDSDANSVNFASLKNGFVHVVG